MLAAFRVRSFRFQWPADLLTSWAFEMETLILGWYVLVETGSVLWLTVFASLSFVGTLIAPMFGVVGDRIGHRDLGAEHRHRRTRGGTVERAHRAQPHARGSRQRFCIQTGVLDRPAEAADGDLDAERPRRGRGLGGQPGDGHVVRRLTDQ